MKKNDGVAAEKAFEGYWNAVGHLERLPDKKALMGLNKGKRVADFAKPSDYLVSSPKHRLHYAEVKSTTHKTGFAFGKIQPKQSSSALKSASRGDGSFIFYIFSYETSQWYMMDATLYAQLVKQGARSVKFKDLPKWNLK